MCFEAMCLRLLACGLKTIPGLCFKTLFSFNALMQLVTDALGLSSVRESNLGWDMDRYAA